MAHLQSLIETVPRKGISYEPKNLVDLIHPLGQWAWDDIAGRKKLHKYAKHVRSSQAFAVNLFGALPDAGIESILGSVFGPMRSVEKPRFEFEDDADRLRESVEKGQRTQVDVFLRGVAEDGRDVALLVEVKLTEVDFGACSGDSEDNDTRHLCSTPGPFGSDPANCFKLRNAGGSERRTYDRYIPVTSIPHSDVFAGCWYRTSAYQPMRNVALAEVLRQEDGIDTAVAVCAPLLHRDMWAHFRRAQSVLPPSSLLPLPAELVLSLHSSETYEFVRDRYFLDIGCDTGDEDELELATWSIIEEFDRWFDHDLVIVETHPGGGQYDCITLAERRGDQLHSVSDLNRRGRVHVHLEGHTRSFDTAWETALAGRPDLVAREIGTALGLTVRDLPVEPVTAAYRRVIELGRRAGETFRWRISERADLRHHDHALHFSGHRLQRQGRQYEESALPEDVFSGRLSR